MAGPRETRLADIICDMDSGWAAAAMGIMAGPDPLNMNAVVNGDVLLGYAYELAADSNPEVVLRMLELGADPNFATVDEDGDEVEAVYARCVRVTNAAAAKGRLPGIHRAVLDALAVPIPENVRGRYDAAKPAAPGAGEEEKEDDGVAEGATYTPAAGVEPQPCGVNMVVCSKCGVEHNACLPPRFHAMECGGPQGLSE
eukprot:TRINITY_DN30755_c0_g1_i1.p1 TRINITY_DN30755_c0_g1~~TRINITY_DN30755_c0_g1_i1.p1  ORF type:complete len:199 (+),score=63.61 TRINITY_DN30755_c0_g1_i1:42-638(+)